MAFITMPAPKVGTTFYDKPGNGRKFIPERIISARVATSPEAGPMVAIISVIRIVNC